MKSRFTVVAASLLLLFACQVPQSLADKIFGTVWLENYVPGEPSTSADEDWAANAKKAKCYLCHVKGKSKRYCNTYGDVLAEWLDSDSFEKERVDAEGEQVRNEILAALEKAESREDACGTPFGELFDSGGLPSAEMGSTSGAREKVAEDAAARDVEISGS